MRSIYYICMAVEVDKALRFSSNPNTQTHTQHIHPQNQASTTSRSYMPCFGPCTIHFMVVHRENGCVCACVCLLSTCCRNAIDANRTHTHISKFIVLISGIIFVCLKTIRFEWNDWQCELQSDAQIHTCTQSKEHFVQIIICSNGSQLHLMPANSSEIRNSIPI